jgi:hypothetical protein
MSNTPKPPPDRDEERKEDLLDRFDEPVIAADDTGMLAGERLITIAELAAADDARER